VLSHLLPEVKNRVEEHFLASELSFTIDGFTHPSSTDRYCLGMFSNIQRTEAIEAARRNIGSGVRFTKEGGDIYVESLSQNSVFVHSASGNCRYV